MIAAFTLENFLNKLFDKNFEHIKEYDFSKTIYKNNSTKLYVEDSFSVGHLISPNNLMNGKKLSVKSAISKKEFYLSRFSNRDLYEYNSSEEEFSLGVYSKINIICDFHGVVEHTINAQLRGRICPKCSRENHPGTFHSIVKTNPLKLTYLYYVKFFNDYEEFYKIGLTCISDIKHRMNQIPYKYKIIKVKSGSALDMFNIEQKIHNYMKNKKLNYIPSIKFGGYTECFKAARDYE